MFVIPRTTQALVKDVRTGEGIAEWLVGIASTVLGLVGDISPTVAAKLVALTVVVKGARRGLIKLAAVLKAGGVADPISFDPSKAGLPATLEQALVEIDTLEQVIAKIQAQSGTPSDQIQAGLAPTSAPVPTFSSDPIVSSIGASGSASTSGQS